MEKDLHKNDDLKNLRDRLDNIRPNSAGFSLRIKATAIFFLQVLKNNNSSEVAQVFNLFIVDNNLYTYDEKVDAIDRIMDSAHRYIFNNTSELDFDLISDKIMEFIDIFNKYPFDYKIIKDIGLEFGRLFRIQNSLNANFDDINNRYNSISNKLDKINYDFIGTISLFVGVIFAVYSGFDLCNTVFDYIGTIDFKYLLITLNVLGYIELSIVSLFIHVIFKINGINTKNIFIFDIVYFIFMIIFIIIVYFVI